MGRYEARIGKRRCDMTTWERTAKPRMRRLRRTPAAWTLLVAAALALSGGLAFPAFAAEPEPVEPEPAALREAQTEAAAATGEELSVLTLADALRLTLEHSPRVQRAASAARQSAAEEEEAQRMLGPRVDMTAGVERAQDPLMGAQEPRSQGQLSLSYQHVIAKTEDTRLALDGARLRTDIARAQEKKETLQALAEVVDAYAGVLEAEAGLRLSQVMARNAEEAERVVRDRLRLGAATEADVMAAQTAARRARQGVETAASSLRLAYEALYRVMGVPLPDRLPRLQSAAELADAVAFGSRLDELTAYAREFHPDLLRAQRALEAAQLALRQTERTDRPRLEMSGSYAWPRSGQYVAFSLDDQAALGIVASHEEPFGSGGKSSAAGSDDTWRVGVQLRFNLTDAGARAAREAKAREQVRQAALQLEEATAALLLALAKQYDDVSQAWRDVALRDADELEALQRYSTVRRQFDAGSATRLDVWQAEGTALGHRADGVRARAKALRAVTALAVTAGVEPDMLVDMFAPAAETQGQGLPAEQAGEE